MLTSDPATLIEYWASVWSSHDVDKFVALFTDDGVYEDVPVGIVSQSKEALKTFVSNFLGAFPDLKVVLKSHFVAGTSAGAEWVLSGTHIGDAPGLPASNKRIAIRGVSVFELQGDKIRRCSDYWDLVTLLKQTGLMPYES